MEDRCTPVIKEEKGLLETKKNESYIEINIIPAYHRIAHDRSLKRKKCWMFKEEMEELLISGNKP
jgi:hypothetical protein